MYGGKRYTTIITCKYTKHTSGAQFILFRYVYGLVTITNRPKKCVWSLYTSHAPNRCPSMKKKILPYSVGFSYWHLYSNNNNDAHVSTVPKTGMQVQTSKKLIILTVRLSTFSFRTYMSCRSSLSLHLRRIFWEYGYKFLTYCSGWCSICTAHNIYVI